jgi:hypothetical protein
MEPTIINAIYACQAEEDSNVSLTIRYESLESIIDLSGVKRFKNGEPELGAFPFTFEDVLLKKDELQAEYDANQYQRDRQAEYPSLLELTVALYDTDDKSAVEAKRAAVKLKYPKPE